MNPQRRNGIKSPEQAMQRTRTTHFPCGQAVAQRLIAYRSVEQTFQQCAQIESCTSRQNRQPPATGNLPDRVARHACVFARGEKFVRVQDIDEMVRNTPPLGWRQFCGAYVEMAIHLQRIAVDDLAVEFFGEQKSQVALSGAGGTYDCNQRPPRCVRDSSVWGFCGQTPLYNEKTDFEPRRGCRAAEKRVGS